ncbi:MAG: WD40 repeat domain-containing protein [Sulfuricurvum sp.]
MKFLLLLFTVLPSFMYAGESLCQDPLFTLLAKKQSTLSDSLLKLLDTYELKQFQENDKNWHLTINQLCKPDDCECLINQYQQRNFELTNKTTKTKVENEPEIIKFTGQEFTGENSKCGFNKTFPKDMMVIAATGGGIESNYRIGEKAKKAAICRVIVNSPKKSVALLLQTSMETIWNISWTEGTKIEAVFLMSNYTQEVSGLQKTTPISITFNNKEYVCENIEVNEKNRSKINLLSNQLFHQNVDSIYSKRSAYLHIGDPIADQEVLYTSEDNSILPYNEIEEKRAICEQHELIYAWNKNANSWQCFHQSQQSTDYKRNEQNEAQCLAQGDNYIETGIKWKCLKLVTAPETKIINNTSLNKKCHYYHGSLQWINNRDICITKATEDEIKKAQIPSFKSSAPTVQQQPKLLIDNQKTEYILYFGLTDDSKYFTTYSAAAQNYITRVYNLSNMEQTYSISRNRTDRSTLHKGLLFLYGNYNSPFEVIDLIQKKSLLLLQGTQIHELAMTNDDSLLLLIDNKRNIIAIDTKTWEKRYTIPATRINLNYKTVLDISKPFFYENIDGQQAAFDIKTGKDIVPLPELPPHYGYEIKTAAPTTLPPELNATKGELFFSTDFHYAIEAEKGFFHIWDLTKKVKLYTHEGRIENSFARIQTTNTHAIFRASQSTYLLDFRNPSLLKQLTYSTDKANNYSQLKSSSLLETGGRISWDLENATAVQQKDRVSQIDSIENKVFTLFRQTIKSLRHIGSIRQIELSPDKSKIIAAVDSGHDIMMWDINKSALDYTIQNQTQFVLTPDSDYIITLSYTPASEDGPPPEHDLNIWNYKTGTLERTLPKRAMTFTLIPNSSLIALGENDGTISIWDYRNGLERYRLIGHDTSIYKLEVLPNKYQLLSQDQGTAILWDNINNTPVGKKQWHKIRNKTLISPDSNYILLIDSQYKKQESIIRLLNLKTSQYEYEFSGSYGTTWGFSPDSKRIYLSTPEGATKVYETATGKELALLHAYDNGEWIIMTPEGYFNASMNGRDFITNASGKPIEDEMYKKYYSPDKVKELLNPKERK